MKKGGVNHVLVSILMQGGGNTVTPRDGFLNTNHILPYDDDRCRKDYSTITAADVTTANVQDNPMYVPLTSPSS